MPRPNTHSGAGVDPVEPSGEHGRVLDAIAAAILLSSADEPEVDRAPSLKVVYAGQEKIRKGQAGTSVERIQEQLNGIGVPAPETGVFDKPTIKAWNHYQEKFGWFATESVGQNPAKHLKKIYGNGKLPKTCMGDGIVLCTDKTQLVLRMMRNGKQLLVTDVRFGTELTPTRNGKFRVYYKKRYLISDLAGTPMPFSLFFSGGQAVHFSPGFQRDGYNGGSLGCVNVRDRKASKQIYRTAPVGSTVYVYRS